MLVVGGEVGYWFLVEGPAIVVVLEGGMVDSRVVGWRIVSASVEWIG